MRWTWRIPSSPTTARVAGGIFNVGTVEVIKSTFSGNDADVGGGIVNGGTLDVETSTFSGNRVTSGGGGIHNGGPAEVTNSTFSGNSASATFEGLPGGGGISNHGTLTVRNTIMANSTRGGNCGGEPGIDGGYNVDDGTTCVFTPATGSLPDTDPLLDPEGLQDNGGLTETIALQPDSPAVDLVGEEACPPPDTDQRGVERPQGGVVRFGVLRAGARAADQGGL